MAFKSSVGITGMTGGNGVTFESSLGINEVGVVGIAGKRANFYANTSTSLFVLMTIQDWSLQTKNR